MTTYRKRSHHDYMVNGDHIDLEEIDKENRNAEHNAKKKKYKSSVAEQAAHTGHVSDYKQAYEKILARHEKLLERAQALKDRHLDMQRKHEETFEMVIQQNDTLRKELQQMGKLENEIVILKRENAQLQGQILEVKAYENEIDRQCMEYEERYRSMKCTWQEAAARSQTLSATVDQQAQWMQVAKQEVMISEDWLSFFTVLSGVNAKGKLSLSGLREQLGTQHDNYAHCEVDESVNDEYEESQYYVLSRQFHDVDNKYVWTYTFAVGPGAEFDVDVVPIGFERALIATDEPGTKDNNHRDEQRADVVDMWTLLPQSMRIAKEYKESSLADSVLLSIVKTIVEVVKKHGKDSQGRTSEDNISPTKMTVHSTPTATTPSPSLSASTARQDKSRRKSVVRFESI